MTPHKLFNSTEIRACMIQSEKLIRSAAKNLEKALIGLAELGYPRLGRIPGSFFEVWVASELVKKGYHPILPSKSADITLKSIPQELLIEVKGSKQNWQNNIPYWGYSFRQAEQVKQEKFHYYILVRASEKGISLDYFVLSKDDFVLDKNFIKRDDDDGRAKYFIELCDSYHEYQQLMKKWDWKPSKIEIMMHKNREDFKDAWDKIAI